MHSIRRFYTTGSFRSPYLLASGEKILSALFIALFFISTAACGQDSWRKPDELFDALQLKEDSWVADVGCREGYYTVRMSQIVKSGWIFAVDINPNALRDLHDNLRENHIENVTPVYSVEDNPMLPRKTLDAALIRNTYHEFTQPMSMLKYIRQSLKKGGRLVIAEAISSDLQNTSRERQARSHEIAINFVKSDLTKAGFRILKETDPFTPNRGKRHFWMLIAIPNSE